MITKREIKLLIENALQSLQEAEDDLNEAMRLISSKGNRSGVAHTIDLLWQTRNSAEDLIYEPDDIEATLETESVSDVEIFELVADGKRIVFSEANH